MQDSVENLVTLFENGTLNRQQLIQGLLAAMAPLSMVAHAQADTSTPSTFRGRSLNHVTLSVTDVERSQAFYSRLLGGTLSCGSIATEQGGKSQVPLWTSRTASSHSTSAGSRGCTTFASVWSTSPSTRLSRNCGAISRNPRQPSIGARNSTFAIPTGFSGRFLGWIIVGSGRHHEWRPTRVELTA
jgi:hypothetical protein